MVKGFGIRVQGSMSNDSQRSSSGGGWGGGNLLGGLGLEGLLEVCLRRDCELPIPPIRFLENTFPIQS